MRKLSEIQNEDALDAIADIIDPVVEICKDAGLKKLMEKSDKLGAAKLAIKNHKSSVLQILAVLDGEPLETYKINIIQLPMKLLELFDDPDLMDFFKLQGLMISDASSGSATENTGETEKE